MIIETKGKTEFINLLVATDFLFYFFYFTFYYFTVSRKNTGISTCLPPKIDIIIIVYKQITLSSKMR